MQLQNILTAVLFLILQFSCSTEQTPPNFVVIILDDQNMELSAFDRSFIKTPNLDRLSSNGIRFSNAYVQQAVCAASRASFLTGLHPGTTGVEYPYSTYFVEEVIPSYGTVSRHFFNHGYATKHFGKVHHGYDETFSGPNYFPGGTRYVSEENIRIDRELGNLGVPPWEMFDGPDTLFQDGRIARAAVAAIEEAAGGDRPFFFVVGFLKPHLPFSAPKKYWDLYERSEIPLAQNKQRAEGCPAIAVDRYNLRQYKWQHDNPDSLFTDDYARLLRHAYFACSSFIDAQIGKIIDKVESSGMIDNTYFVFMSDHGFHLGEQNHWGKTTFFESALKSPLIISGKKLKKAGSSSTSLVEFVDIMPTLLDLAGITIPDHAEGYSLVPLLSDPAKPFRKAVFSNQERDALGRKKGFSVRDHRYRYSEWKNTSTGEVIANELYDLESDPLQTRNIVNDPGYSDVVSGMAEMLHSGWKSAVPDGVTHIADNPEAPPAYSWGTEGVPRRALWHEVYGGNEEDGWEKAIETRRLKEGGSSTMRP